MNKAWGELAKLRPAELADLIEKQPIVYLPSGICEWHDEHLPLGTDTFKVVEVCRLAARRSGGVVHMPSYIGIGPFRGPKGRLQNGALNYSASLIRAYLAELFAQLEAVGFRLIVLLVGHTYPENVNAHQEASLAYLCGEETSARVLCIDDVEPVVRDRYKVADHAAKWETSFMLASYPGRVRLRDIPADHGRWHGLDPREHASAAAGERMYGLIAENVAHIVVKARYASLKQLEDVSFLQNSACWKRCQNYADLQDGYWGGDERWEDPFCFYCVWRAPGVVRALADLKGRAWVQRRVGLWDTMSAPYTGRARRAWQALEDELAGL